jgi:hypothetical protein
MLSVYQREWQCEEGWQHGEQEIYVCEQLSPRPKKSQILFPADLYFPLIVFILRRYCAVRLAPGVRVTPSKCFGNFKFRMGMGYLSKPWDLSYHAGCKLDKNFCLSTSHRRSCVDRLVILQHKLCEVLFDFILAWKLHLLFAASVSVKVKFKGGTVPTHG